MVLTKSADFFLQRAKDYDASSWADFDAATKLEDGARGRIAVVRDEDEWEAWNAVGDSVRHIEVCTCRDTGEEALRETQG